MLTALRRGAAVSLALAGAAGAAAAVWGVLIERTAFALRTVTVPVLDPGAAPLRVLHLSDLHMAPWQRDKQEWVRALADLEPDLIVDTGDDLGHRRGVEGIRYAYERFAGIPGVYVHGSNDYFGPVIKNPLRYFGGPSRPAGDAERLDTAELEAFLDGLGWTDLDNAATVLRVARTRVTLFGVNDPHRGYDRLDRLTAALDDAEGSVEEADDDLWPDALERHDDDRASTLRVGVVHAPYQRVLNSFLNHGAELILAGHTHGGQVCLPGVGALVANCDLPRQQAKGLSLWRHGLRAAWLHVSAGLGTSITAPVRFACRPEATLLTLVPRP